MKEFSYYDGDGTYRVYELSEQYAFDLCPLITVNTDVTPIFGEKLTVEKKEVIVRALRFLADAVESQAMVERDKRSRRGWKERILMR